MIEREDSSREKNRLIDNRRKSLQTYIHVYTYTARVCSRLVSNEIKKASIHTNDTHIWGIGGVLIDNHFRFSQTLSNYFVLNLVEEEGTYCIFILLGQ